MKSRPTILHHMVVVAGRDDTHHRPHMPVHHAEPQMAQYMHVAVVVAALLLSSIATTSDAARYTCSSPQGSSLEVSASTSAQLSHGCVVQDEVSLTLSISEMYNAAITDGTAVAGEPWVAVDANDMDIEGRGKLTVGTATLFDDPMNSSPVYIFIQNSRGNTDVAWSGFLRVRGQFPPHSIIRISNFTGVAHIPTCGAVNGLIQLQGLELFHNTTLDVLVDSTIDIQGNCSSPDADESGASGKEALYYALIFTTTPSNISGPDTSINFIRNNVSMRGDTSLVGNPWTIITMAYTSFELNLNEGTSYVISNNTVDLYIVTLREQGSAQLIGSTITPFTASNGSSMIVMYNELRGNVTVDTSAATGLLIISSDFVLFSGSFLWVAHNDVRLTAYGNYSLSTSLCAAGPDETRATMTLFRISNGSAIIIMHNTVVATTLRDPYTSTAQLVSTVFFVQDASLLIESVTSSDTRGIIRASSLIIANNDMRMSTSTSTNPVSEESTGVFGGARTGTVILTSISEGGGIEEEDIITRNPLIQNNPTTTTTTTSPYPTASYSGLNALSTLLDLLGSRTASLSDVSPSTLATLVRDHQAVSQFGGVSIHRNNIVAISSTASIVTLAIVNATIANGSSVVLSNNIVELEGTAITAGVQFFSPPPPNTVPKGTQTISGNSTVLVYGGIINGTTEFGFAGGICSLQNAVVIEDGSILGFVDATVSLRSAKGTDYLGASASLLGVYTLLNVGLSDGTLPSCPSTTLSASPPPFKERMVHPQLLCC